MTIPFITRCERRWYDNLMNLFFKIAVLVLSSLSAFVGFEVYQLQTIISDYDRNLAGQCTLRSQNIERKINQTMVLLQKHSEILALSDEVGQAIAQVDNEVLSRLGHGFLGVCDSVLFTDRDGRVLARQPDEFRFGDLISTAGYFARQTPPEMMSGVSLIDSQLSFFVIVPVKKYDDIVEGAVMLTILISPDMLNSIVEHPDLQLRVTADQIVVNSQRPQGEISHAMVLKPQPGYGFDSLQFEVRHHNDQNYQRLVRLKHTTIVNGIIAAAILFSICAYFLYRYLTPHAKIVSLIQSYSDVRNTTSDIQDDLKIFEKSDDRDIRKIAEALTHMLETIKENNLKIENSNRNLEQTVRELEKSLAEVKTLSGLLPICSYCKKIRDDGGYWNRLEEYLSSRSDTSFSHSICPDCLKKNFPEYRNIV